MRAWMRSLTSITTMRTIPKVKVEVDKMIAEEMRVSANKPADFLAELPAMPTINPQRGPDEEKEMTHKDFDMSELRRIAFCFGVEVAVTVGIHVCMAYVPVLFIEMVSEPFTFYDQAYYLFALYILNSKDDKLKRPLPVDSPVAKSEAAEQERQVKTNDDDVGEPTPAIEDSANTTGSQPLSRAERRPRRVESVDVNEE